MPPLPKLPSKEIKNVNHDDARNYRITALQLREFMETHGITANELSQIFGVSYAAVSFWLDNKRPISLTNSRLIRMFWKYPKLIREF